MAENTTFNPWQYVTQINGNDYLPVAARLAWFRDRFPNGTIDMEMLGLDHVTIPGTQNQTERAIFKAKVSNGEGGHAVGYGSETQNDFRDHIEKASTKALGRALAALGFGTLESGSEYSGEVAAGRIVDAPVRPAGGYQQPAGAPQQAPRPQNPSGYQNAPQRPQNGPQQPQQQGNNYQQAQQQGGGQFTGDPNRPASPRQVGYVADLLRGLGHDPDRFDWSGLTAGEASAYINTLRAGQLPQDVADALAQIAPA